MLKGHVQIELHNHKTGLRDRIEQDNLVTNAVPLITNALSGRGISMNNLMPLATKGYGGIMIFSDPLTLNANNVYLPGDNFITAYAGQILNTSDPMMGSLNQSESGPTDDGYVNTWEFSTSQANGYVSSLSLTNANVVNFIVPHLGTLASICDTNSSFVNRGNTSLPNEGFKIGNNFYYTTVSGSTGTKYKLKAQTQDFTLTDAVNTTYSPEVIRTMTSSSGAADSTDITRLGTRCYYGFDGYIYHIPYMEPATNTLLVYKAPIETTDAYTWETISISTERRYTSNVSGFIDAVSDGYFFRDIEYVRPLEGSDHDTLAFTIDDIANAEETHYEYQLPISEDTTNLTSKHVCPLRGGGVIIWYGSGNNAPRKIIQLTSDGRYKIYREGTNLGNVSVPTFWWDDATVTMSSQYRTLAIPVAYLGTVANIEYPFEKTNAVSMKVRYTLTQV